MKDLITIDSGRLFSCAIILILVAVDNYQTNRFIEQNHSSVDFQKHSTTVFWVVVVIVVLLSLVFFPGTHES